MEQGPRRTEGNEIQNTGFFWDREETKCKKRRLFVGTLGFQNS